MMLQLICNPRRKTFHAFHFATLVLFGLVVAGGTVSAQEPVRLKRADSFLGIHFDFHAGKDCTNVGAHTTPAMIENIINLVHPDYLQIDCKGHPGWSSYPTKVGNPVPGFVGDPLRVWRNVTAKRGVALYMHYSGVADDHACQIPGWAAINAEGQPNQRATSLFGSYTDRLLIPQLRELATVYKVDGVWVDGDCWAAVRDYSEPALKAFHAATGIQSVPRKPGEPYWFEFLEFHRDAFRKNLRHEIAEVKKASPAFQFCSNWSFTDHMPEPVTASVDFLSGDFDPNNSVNSARFAARYLVRQGKPWDLMAWSFSRNPKDKLAAVQKSAEQLEREAAVVIALGGGLQVYFKQKRDGSIYDEQMPVMAEVAKFSRERQQLCHHSEPVPQIALLLSTPGHYRKIDSLFGRNNNEANGVLQALVESQQSVEVVGEHQITGRLSQYPLIVVPEWDYLDLQFKKELTDYVKAGGNLLLVGPKTAALFKPELGVELLGKVKPAGSVRIVKEGEFTVSKSESQMVKLDAQSVSFGTLAGTNQTPAASIKSLGRGKIAATYFSLGLDYRDAPSFAVRSFLNELAGRMFTNPIVRVEGSADVDVCLMRNKGKLLVNLINTSGQHRTEPVTKSIVPIGPLTVSIRQAVKPVKVTLQPSGEVPKFDYAAGTVNVTVPQLKIHEVVVIENK